MWRIPAFMVGFILAFAIVTSAAVMLASVSFVLAMTAVVVGGSAIAIGSFPALNWVVDGHWTAFYRKRGD